MKRFDLVKLINDDKYKDNGVFSGFHGIILNTNLNDSEVLFFNKQILGEVIKVKISNNDLKVENAELPENIKNEIIEKFSKNDFILKNKFTKLKLKQYDLVELIVEDEKYSKFGIHIGDKGCVMEIYAVKNYVLVDFSGVDKNGDFYGDCIKVKIDDLRTIETNKK